MCCSDIGASGEANIKRNQRDQESRSEFESPVQMLCGNIGKSYYKGSYHFGTSARSYSSLQPIPAQQMVGRVKSGRNFKSIPWLVLQRAAALIDCKASTQTLRMALHRDPDFPRIITTDSTFMRNFRLYIKMKGITGPKPTTTTAHGGAVDFEEIMYVPNHCLVVDQLQQTSFLYFIFCFNKAADQSTH